MINNGPALTKDNEGYSCKVYLDSEGYPTHGYGFLLEKVKYKSVREYHDALFAETYRKAEDSAKILGLNDLDPVRWACVVDLVYNLGIGGFIQFKATLAALRMKDWNAAAHQLEQSKWYRQVGRRGTRICRMIRSGKWEDA